MGPMRMDVLRSHHGGTSSELTCRAQTQTKTKVQTAAKKRLHPPGGLLGNKPSPRPPLVKPGTQHSFGLPLAGLRRMRSSADPEAERHPLLPTSPGAGLSSAEPAVLVASEELVVPLKRLALCHLPAGPQLLTFPILFNIGY